MPVKLSGAWKKPLWVVATFREIYDIISHIMAFHLWYLTWYFGMILTRYYYWAPYHMKCTTISYPVIIWYDVCFNCIWYHRTTYKWYIKSYMISYQISRYIVHTDIAYDIIFCEDDIIFCEEVCMISYIISYMISSYISSNISHTNIAYDIIVFVYDIICDIVPSWWYHTYDIAYDIIVKTMIS